MNVTQHTHDDECASCNELYAQIDLWVVTYDDDTKSVLCSACVEMVFI